MYNGALDAMQMFYSNNRAYGTAFGMFPVVSLSTRVLSETDIEGVYEVQ